MSCGKVHGRLEFDQLQPGATNGLERMSQTVRPDPYPMCPQKECGYPISGCRNLDCINTKCRDNHKAQGVELKYRPPREFEFHEKFDTQEMPWRPSRGVALPNYGYEVPYKPSRHFFAPNLITQPTLKCNAVPTKDQPWRAQRKTFPCQTGALSGDDAIRHRKYLAPLVGEAIPESVKVPMRPACENFSSQASSERDWKPALHISGKVGCETMQADYHPSRRHFHKSGSTATPRHAKKAPGVYKRDCGEWLPPFRAPTPEMVAPGCVPWQSPKKRSGKKAAPDCLSQHGEWQPAFRSCSSSLSAPTTPQNQRPASRQGLKHCQCRPDEWCPPWKQPPQQQQQRQFGQQLQPPPQQQTSNVDRNTTINEDANCTHYLDDDERDELQQGRLACAESTTEEEDGDGEKEDGHEEEDELRKSEAANEHPSSQKPVDEYFAPACDACDKQQSGGAGRLPGATNTCWSAAADD